MSAAPAGTQAGTARGSEPGAGVSFIRGSGEGRYVFEVQSGIVQGGTQDIGPIDVKAYDYMRSILLFVQATGGGGTTATYNADAPFNAISYLRVKQPNGQTMYSVSSGYHAAMIHKYGLIRPTPYTDPRAYVSPVISPAVFSTANTGNFSFVVRIPFELDLRDALGALPNKDAAAPFTLEIGLNSTTTIYAANPATFPTIKITPVLEAYDQPPESLDGKPVETVPPNMNTLQRWTEQSITMVSGSFDARVRKLGNYVRELVFITKNASSVRQTAANGWSDPMQIVLDEDVKDNVPLWLWTNDIQEIWGYGAEAFGATAAPALDTAGGPDTGVFPYQYCCDRDNPYVEDVAKYLPTIESEDYLLRGQSWGANVGKLVVLKCEVLPRGDIFGEA
jgi:hypothetical protein